MQIARGDHTGIVHLIRLVVRSCDPAWSERACSHIARVVPDFDRGLHRGARRKGTTLNTRTIAIAALVLVVIVLLIIFVR
jgi:hypothetical protein